MSNQVDPVIKLSPGEEFEGGGKVKHNRLGDDNALMKVLPRNGLTSWPGLPGRDQGTCKDRSR